MYAIRSYYACPSSLKKGFKETESFALSEAIKAELPSELIEVIPPTSDG